MPKSTHIGDRIKTARKLANISQIQLSEILGINQSNLSRMEKGTQEPNISQLRMLKHALQTDYDYLIDGKSRISAVSKVSKTKEKET